MSSIVPDFEYDIFISYRHNDNRSGWVTEFVNALQEELAATIKEPLTIYFDKNPHDGLLETHHVDKSLEGKLKSLIFIPIISQTYCDTKSFAWQHEFVAFNKLSKEDQFGRDVKLGNGNVASRILPIKIHEIDGEDKATIENEIGGILRAIEFIFKEPGVNRPLKLSDKRENNQSQTDYTNQLNKVANAIKELISTLKNPNLPTQPKTKSVVSPAKSDRRTRIGWAVGLSILVLAVAGYFLYSKLVSSTNIEISLTKSIAVLPFADLSEHKDQGWFGDGLTEEVLNSLANVKGLSVSSRTSSFAFKDKNLRIQDIADSLGVNYIVEGSIRKSNNGFRITAQLIRASDGFHVWSSTYDRGAKDIFQLQKEIATKIAESLDISLDPKAIEKMHSAGTTNPEAYIKFLQGNEIFLEGHNKRKMMLPYLKRANISFAEAIQIDSSFINSYFFQADYYYHYLLKSENTIHNDTLTEAQAYQLLQKGIETAINKSKTAIERDYYRLYAIMFSDDWSPIRPIAERVLNSPEAVRLFSYQPFNLVAMLTSIGYGEKVKSISRAMLKNDPSNQLAFREIIEAKMHEGDYEGALLTCDSLKNFHHEPRLAFDKLFCLYQLNRIEEAYQLIEEMDSTSITSFRSMKAMILAKKASLQEAKQQMNADSRVDYRLEAIAAAYGREAANAEAAKFDQKLVNDHMLLFCYLFAPNNLPFDASATPNFARRLKQVGIILK